MRIGVPREAKEGDKRAALGPGHVARLVAEGHDVRMERGAGRGIDADYANAEARLAAAEEAWECELVVKTRALAARGAVSHRGIAEEARPPYTPLFAEAPQ